MKKFIVVFFLCGCINHPQYCRTHDDCLRGQYCPAVRSPDEARAICKGKAWVDPKMLTD